MNLDLTIYDQEEHTLPNWGYYCETDPEYRRVYLKFTRYIGAPSEALEWPKVRGVPTFLFEMVGNWYIGAAFTDQRQDFGEVIGPFPTPEQAFVHLKLIEEH